MARLARSAGLPWDAIVGADIAHDYKPQAAVYTASAAALGLAPEAVMMVAAHNFDLAAAREAGLKTAFVSRPDEYGDGPVGTPDLAPATTGKPWCPISTLSPGRWGWAGSIPIQKFLSICTPP